MINFLSQNELCYSIFSIKLDDHLQFSNLRPKLQALVPKRKFPILNFKKYQNDYKNGIDFFILLKRYNFSFPFDRDFLDELSRKDNQSVNETHTSPDYIALIVLHSFITWYINFIQNHSLTDVLILLRSLLVVMNIKNCKVISKNRSYAASAFMNTYSEIVESTYITNIIDIFPPIVEFLTMNDDLPQNSFDLLLKLGNRVIDPTSTNFTKEMSHFVNFVVIIVRTCGNRCPSYITSAIVSLMSKSLIGLDKDALLFFGRSLKTLGIDTAFSIISELPDSIMKKIVENPNPIFECSSLKDDKGLVFPANDVIFEKKLVTFSTFETDIRKLIKIPPYFPDLLSPKDLILPEILEIFELIYKIVESEEKLKEILITKITSLLSSCPITSHYYDINSAFLYFLLILSKDCKFNSIPREIFLSHLFRQNETVFNYSDDFQKINTIRHLAFLLLINQAPDTIFKALLTIRLKPYTFAEFTYRLLPEMGNLTKLLNISVPVFEGVMTSIVFYQKFQNISEELKIASCEARIAGFTYIDIMLKIPDFRRKFFESSLCVDAIISLVFEKMVRNWALLKIIDAFYLENTSFNYLIESCLKLFQISSDFGFTKGEIQQLESLIRFLDHDIFNSTNKIELLKNFEPAIANICSWIAGLIKSASKDTELPKTTSNSVPSSPSNHKKLPRPKDKPDVVTKTPPRHRPIPHFQHPNPSNANEAPNIKSRANSNKNSGKKLTANSKLMLNIDSNSSKNTNTNTNANTDSNSSKSEDKNADPNSNKNTNANTDSNSNANTEQSPNSNRNSTPQPRIFHRRLKGQVPSSTPAARRKPVRLILSSDSDSDSNSDLEMKPNANDDSSSSTPRITRSPKKSLDPDANINLTPRARPVIRAISTPRYHRRKIPNSDSSPEFEVTPQMHSSSSSNRQLVTSSEDSSQDFETTPKQQTPSKPNYKVILSSDSSLNSEINLKETRQSSPKKASNDSSPKNENLAKNSSSQSSTSSLSSNLKLAQKSSQTSTSSSTTASSSSIVNQNSSPEANPKQQIRRRRRRSQSKADINQEIISSSTPASPFFPQVDQHSQSNSILEHDESFIDSSMNISNNSTKLHSSSNSNLKTNKNFGSNQSPQASINSRTYYKNLLNKLMNILTRFSVVHTLSQSDISLIDTTANFLYDNEPSEEFFKRLICSIAGEFLRSTEPSFDIKQPKAMKLIITLFNRSEKLLSKINYIVSLCNYSTKNCEQLQKGEFDLFLVGRLFNLRNNLEIKKEVFTRALLILRLISAHSCSVSFVHQYVSLFCPIDCKILPRFHQEILDSMQILLQNSGKVPATPLPIFSTTQVNASNVRLTNSFTVFFWFFIYSNEEPITVVEITNENKKFSVQIWHEHITIYFQMKPEQWNASLSFDLPLNQWSFATFSVRNQSENDNSVIHAAVNGNILPLNVFPYFDFSENLSKVDVGITDCDKLSVMLGSLGITPYFEPSYNISLFDSGPRKAPINPLFFIRSHNKNDNYEIEVVPSSVTASTQTVRSLHKPSFTDILIEICGVSILLPIVVNINLSYKNGENVPFLLEQFIEILEMSLTLSYNSQRIFASEKSFLIISNILLSLKRIELNYNVFFRFCSLFELLDNEKCRSQLLFGILMKFDLWIRCDAFNLKRILRYWNNSLVPLHLHFIMKKIKLNDIIAALRIFFWYDQIESDIILNANDRLIFHLSDIRACRQHLLSIAFMMAHEELTNNEFKFIVSQILSLDDKEQILDLLHFVDDLIDNRDKIAMKSENVMESLVYLMFLYTTDLSVLELSLNIVIKAYNLSLIKEMKLEDHFELMIHELPGCFAYPPMLIKLLEICSTKEPKLFSLCSMIAFSFGQSSFNNLLEILKPNPLYCSSPTWSLWSVISLFKINDSSFQDRLIKFLILISPNEWKNIFWTVDNVGRALKIDPKMLKRKFIVELSNYLLKLDDPDELLLRHYFILVPQFLFLRSYFQHNDYLKFLFHKSFKKKRVIRSPTSSSTSIPNINNNNNDSDEDHESSKKNDSGTFGEYVTPVRARPPRPHNYEPKIKKARASQMTYGKRSSFRSFDNLSFISNKEKFMNLDFIKFKISDFISMIKNEIEKGDYKVYFGLRINEENVWEDIDIAKIANQLFKKFPRQIYYDSCLFINSFMLHYDPDDAIETVNSLKAPNEQTIVSFDCSLFNKHADNLHCKKIFDEHPSSYLQKSYQALQQFENMYHENKSFVDIYNNLVSNDDKAKKLSFNFEIDISQMSTEIIADFKENLNLRNTKYSKFWSHFWRAMTIGRAPWRQSLSEDQKKIDIYFRRDFVLCSSMCPFRTRPNYNFDKHKEASRKRDNELSNSRGENFNLSRSGTLLSVFGSQASFNTTRNLFSISNSNLLESTTDFNNEQLRIFGTNDQIDSSSEDTETTPVSENSKCIFESTCEIITVTNKYEALFSLQKECVVITKSVQTARVIKNVNITAVLLRTVLHRETAIEIFLDDGISYLVNFPEVKSSEIIKQFKVLKKSLQNPFFLQIQPPKQLASFSKCTILWQNKKISNFDYLMILNILSGRSFNDPSQYPYLPWILKDYTSDKLDLNNPEIYRDLSKPVGTLGVEKFEQLKMSMEGFPYLFSSGNVSPLIVFLWLVRVEPFTTLQIKEQGGSFDAPDRQFKSIEEAYHSILTLSSDFRELIPEFFFQPEFLVNMNNFDLGISNDKKVNDIELPKWIKTESKTPIVAAYEFIYLHRKALESDHVSAHLNKWIDLVWGDKSRGQKAIEFNNVYSPEMYPEIWESQSEIELEDNIPAIEAILSYVGQIPAQLFDKPHPQRCCNVDKTVLDNIISYQTRTQKCKINIGAIIILNDMKTVAILTIDDNGACSENDVDINYLQKSSLNISQDDSDIPTNHQSNVQLKSPMINRASSQKLISLLNSNENNTKSPSLRKSTDSGQIVYQNVEGGSSHFDPSTFDQTIWKPAFLSSSPSQSSLFVPSNGFNMPSSRQNSNLNNGSAANLWKKFLIVDSYQKSDLYLVDPKSGLSERIVRQRNDITAISTDACKWLAVANKDSKIYIYSLDEANKANSKHDSDDDLDGRKSLLKVEFSIPSFRDYVKCCDISTTFHTIVCGTRDNSLMICSLTSHSIIKIVELDSKPIILIVTPSWGFTVIYMRSISEGKSTHYIAVYGTNGYLIRKVEIENSVKKFVAWRDEKGFDFIFFADSQNRIYAFEAFYCEIGKPIFETSSNVIDIAYMESHHAAVILCEDGMTYFIPVSFN